jgi:hypothetical protein
MNLRADDKIVESYADKAAVTEGAPDIEKVDPLVYANGKYYRVGDFVTDAFSAGKAYKK